jgi:hypothetical protein
MSATELEKIACGDTILKSFSYHLKRLVKEGVLEVVGKLKARRSRSANKETFFFFAGQYQWISQIAVLNDSKDPLMAAALHHAALLQGTDYPAPADVLA